MKEPSNQHKSPTIRDWNRSEKRVLSFRIYGEEVKRQIGETKTGEYFEK